MNVNQLQGNKPFEAREPGDLVKKLAEHIKNNSARSCKKLKRVKCLPIGNTWFKNGSVITTSKGGNKKASNAC